MSRSLPKILRRDAQLFQVGRHFRQVRKNRDEWQLTETPSGEDVVLYYHDIRPGGNA